jgi:carbamoyltransferase
VNTSLNVGAPIAQTPVHALETLKRSTGMHALLMIAESGDVFVVWHDVERGPKDGGRTLRAWMREWGGDAFVARRPFPPC